METLLVAFILFVVCFDTILLLTALFASGKESRKEEAEKKEIGETLQKVDDDGDV